MDNNFIISHRNKLADAGHSETVMVLDALLEKLKGDGYICNLKCETELQDILQKIEGVR